MTLKHTSGELLMESRIKIKNIIKVLLAVGILFAIILSIFLFKLKQTTPYEYLQNHFNKSDSAVYPVELLYETNDESNENIILVFYATNGGFNCAVLEKTPLSFKLLDYSGSLFFRETKMQYEYGYYSGSYLCSWYDYDGERKSIFWGINRDESVENLLVDGEKSECVKMDYFKIFWKIGNWEDEPPFEEIQTSTTE